MDKGANRRKRFAFWKAEDMAGENGELSIEDLELLQALIETECDEEVNLAEAFKKQQLDAKAVNAIKGALRLLSGVKDKLSPEMRSALDKLANVAGYPSPATDKAGHKDDGKNKNPGGALPMSKSQDPKPADPAATPAVPEGATDDVKAFMKAQADQIEMLTKANEASTKRLEAVEQERILEGFVKRAKDDLAFYPGISADDIGKQLADLHATNPELAEQQFKSMKTASDAFEKSAALTSTGGGGGGGSAVIGGGNAPAGSALEEMQRLADQEFAKADAKDSKEQAFAKAMRANPGLYRQYLQENPALTSIRQG